MIPSDTLGWGTARNCIREVYEYGLRLKAEIGEDKVFDFSLGNPSVPAPPQVREAILKALEDPTLHDYTVAPGRPSLRQAIADNLNAQYGTNLAPTDIYVTCGASAAVTCSIKGLLKPGEEAVAFAPHYPEYPVFTRTAGGKFVFCSLRREDLQMDIEALEAVLTENTAVVLVNSPNNPSGAVLNEESLRKLADCLYKAQERFGHPIYIISDEPYRELVYDLDSVPSPIQFYDNTVVCYSYSKSLSLPGERIGYYAVSDRAERREEVFASLAGAARSYGYVNPPSLMQRVVEACVDLKPDISTYRENRDILCGILDEVKMPYIHPDGAFYLFIRSPEPEAKVFCKHARKYGLLLVPSNDFGITGYARAAYCVKGEMIRRSRDAFKALAQEYGMC